MPDLGFDAVSSSLAEFMPISYSSFFSNFFLYYVRNPNTTDNRQQTTHEQCRVRVTTSWPQRYTRLPPASKAGS